LDEDIVVLLQNESKTYFEPGTNFQYSNTGFCLLAMVTERVSGMRYRLFMQNEIFRKLGMHATFMYDPQHPAASRALGYALSAGEWVPRDQSLTSATLGDGCVYTSLNDYLIWYKALRNNVLVDIDAKLREIHYSFPTNRSHSYGLGWFCAYTGNGQELTHTGSTSGFSNLIIQVPAQDLLIVCFSNVASNHEIFKDVVQIIQDDSNFHFDLNWWEFHNLTN
jgi:CubicO group peptidase (beta-lactamase class C family)